MHCSAREELLLGSGVRVRVSSAEQAGAGGGAWLLLEGLGRGYSLRLEMLGTAFLTHAVLVQTP